MKTSWGDDKLRPPCPVPVGVARAHFLEVIWYDFTVRCPRKKWCVNSWFLWSQVFFDVWSPNFQEANPKISMVWVFHFRYIQVWSGLTWHFYELGRGGTCTGSSQEKQQQQQAIGLEISRSLNDGSCNDLYIYSIYRYMIYIYRYRYCMSKLIDDWWNQNMAIVLIVYIYIRIYILVSL